MSGRRRPERGIRGGRVRLRGWGGVAGMASACTLALTAALLLPGTGGSGGTRSPAAAPKAPQVQARYAADQDCSNSATTLDPATGAVTSLDPNGGTQDGAAVERIKHNKRLVVGVDQNSYLWGYRDPVTGDIAGFDIAIVKAIAQSILGPDAQVQYLTIPTDQRIPMIRAHKVDMVVRTMSVTCDRLTDPQQQVAFSSAYFEAGQQLLVPDNSTIKGFDDSLNGKHVCTASGSTGAAKLAQDAHGAKVTLVPNQLDCLVRVQLGLANAVFTDNALAAGQAAQDPSMRLAGERVTTEPYGVAMNLDDTDLIRRVNAVLASYGSGGADSPWMRAYDKWLAQHLPGIGGPPQAHYK
ncbi:glutamate ABC transporter substrate-binding protein [Actinacidiphila alni]|uniref:glutamate ABC transporter substrate-binding protein n=1 Tax=Actinacidiphila alni TaxID=380248 RepID=UPI001FEC9DB2|nr:glutamate ABC transporter substrate-binding protein [Actinacidiphila alni]